MDKTRGPESPILNYDNILEYLGQFGYFQKKVFFCMCLVSFLTGPPIVVFAFTGQNLVDVKPRF